MAVRESLFGDIVTVEGRVESDTRDVTKTLLRDQAATVVFEDLNGGKAAGNIFSTREKVAKALNIPKEDIVMGRCGFRI